MRFLAVRTRATLIACAVGLGAALASAPALAVGEEITDVRIMGNTRTEESTVRSVAGVSIGDTLETGTLDLVRERLNTMGLFSDVNVWWEQYKTGVRVNIAVKDKFPWAPVPTGSWSANNRAFGLLFVHGNLFGRGKQLLLGGRIADVDSGAALGYRDPSFFGSWIYWQVQGNIQRQDIPEYYPGDRKAEAGPYRSTLLVSYATELTLGVAWWRRVRTQVAWRLEQSNFDRSYIPDDAMMDPLTTASTASARNGRRQGVAESRFPRPRVLGHDRHRAGRRRRHRAPRFRRRPEVLARGRRRPARGEVLQEPQPGRRRRRDVREGSAVLDGEHGRADRTCAAISTSSSAATARSAPVPNTTSRCSRSARWTSARWPSTTFRRSGSATSRPGPR